MFKYIVCFILYFFIFLYSVEAAKGQIKSKEQFKAIDEKVSESFKNDSMQPEMIRSSLTIGKCKKSFKKIEKNIREDTALIDCLKKMKRKVTIKA